MFCSEGVRITSCFPGGKYLKLTIVLIAAATFLCAVSPAQQSEADPSAPRQITGCLRRHYFLNAYDLHNGKDKIKVVGPRTLMDHVGQLVTVTGTWRNYGSFGGKRSSDGDPFFAVTELIVVADRCPVAPPEANGKPQSDPQTSAK